MIWLWIALFIFGALLFGTWYVLMRLIDKHYALESKFEEKYLDLSRDLNQFYRDTNENDIRITTLVEDVEYLDKCAKEDAKRAGLAFAKLENRIGKIGVRLQALEDATSNTE